MTRIFIAVLLLFAGAAWADPFASSQYECDQVNKSADAGFKCRLLAGDGPTSLLIWAPPNPKATDDDARRRQYQIQQIMDAFVSRGGRFIEVRGKSHSGEVTFNNCEPTRLHTSALCNGWQPLKLKDGKDLPEWTALMN